MSIPTYTAMARRHWKEWLPEKTRELEEAGTYSLETQKAAARAQEEITSLMRQGWQEHEAEELVLPQHILLVPEEGASGLDEELDAELEEMEREYQANPPAISYL